MQYEFECYNGLVIEKNEPRLEENSGQKIVATLNQAINQ